MSGSNRPGVHGNPPSNPSGGASFPSAGREGGRATSNGAREGAFVLCLLPLLAGVGGWVAQGADGVWSPGALLALALGTAGWAGALHLARGLTDGTALFVVLASGALALRLPFLAVDPGLSDDVHRYVWEGALVGAGIDPYAHAPLSEELTAQRERWDATFRRVNHPEVSAAYPPLVQAVNAGLVAAAGGAEHSGRARFVLRLFYATCDLLVCVPLGWILARARRPRLLVVAWAWNPLVAFEFAGQAHLDSLGILCLLLALACFPRPPRVSAVRSALGLAFLAAGAAVKLLPAALLPFVLRRAGRPLFWGAFFGACFVLACLPFALLTGHAPGLGGIREYAFRWESFSLLHRWLEPLFARRFEYDEAWSDPRRLARALELGLWCGLGFLAWWRLFELPRAAALLVGGFLVLTPTLHPWYLSWIVPFLALRPAPAWSVLVAAAPLLYWPVRGWRAEGVWAEPGWLYPLLGGLFWVLSLHAGVRALRAPR